MIPYIATAYQDVEMTPLGLNWNELNCQNDTQGECVHLRCPAASYTSGAVWRLTCDPE